MKKVLIIGCGAIFNRHYSAILKNDDFELVAICDIDKNISDFYGKKLKIKNFYNYENAIKNSDCNFVVVCTPNSLHFEQAKFALENKKEVLIEKPVSFESNKIDTLSNLSKKHKSNCYCVLQVRLNETIKILKKCLNRNLLGEIRAVNLVQRWQRPYEYFSGWRNIPEIGGGTLYEVGIHYIDIMQLLFGVPKIHSSIAKTTKHKNSMIEDTIYAIMDFGNYGGTLEVTVAAEPHNLECSLQILGSNGYVKIGGKAMNSIDSYNFLSNGATVSFEEILKEEKNPNLKPNNYGSYLGSCPNHEDVYKNLNSFKIKESKNSIEIIEKIYKSAGIHY